MKRPRKILFDIFILVFVTRSLVIAGSAGKISGLLKDFTNQEALIGANIILEGTVLGAASDLEGRYTILNVPPGKYRIRFMMMGYTPVFVDEVIVSVDHTTNIDVEMRSTVLESGESVTIIAERPMVVKDLTASTAVIGAEEMESLPVSEVMEAVELQAGLVKDAAGGLHVRGGRAGEVSFWIDGMPVTDVYDGGSVVDVNKDMVQELQVISGAFNAEYGQAMSGIVNITTKEGSNDFGGSLTAYCGDNVSNALFSEKHFKQDDIFTGINEINPLAIRNLEGSFHGPLVNDKLFFNLTARTIYFDGWNHGTRTYNPGAMAYNLTFDQTFLDENMPEYANSGRALEGDMRGISYILGSSFFLDSLIVTDGMPEAALANPDSFQQYYDEYMSIHGKGPGDGKTVPMNWNRKIYAQAKLMYRFTPSMKLSYNYIMDDVDYRDYDREYQLNPDGDLKRYRVGQTHIGQWTHTLSASTFYQFGVSYFIKDYQHHTYSDMNNPLYVHPDLSIADPYTFRTAGTNNSWFSRKTKTLLTKLDLTSQVTSTHQLKFGGEFRQHDIDFRDVTLRPIASQTSLNFFEYGPYIQTRVLPDSTIYASQYQHSPQEFSAYIQDKMEFKNMIVNLGVRVDYFNPDGVVLNDETDPTIANPIRPENRYHDYGSDGLPDTFDADGSEGNGLQDPGEPSVSYDERLTYWYKDATSKLKFSPRLGVSFPITDRGAIYFSYGHFFQIPRFERLYQNPDFELGSGTGNVGVIGNADLEPEQTVSGEIGVQQQLSEDIAVNITGYFRDIRSLAGTRAEEIILFGGAAKYSKFVNSDFGFVRGLTIAFNKRFSNHYAVTLDYTLQVAKDSNSDPEAARNALAGGTLPEVQLTPNGWDQQHTINSSFTYGSTDWGVSLIGQWGSGLPYSPRRSTDITSLLINSQRKPMTVNVDMRAYRDFQVGPGKLTLFLRISNLFDNLNEINVFEDTGRAGFTTDQAVAAATNPPEFVNSLDQYYTNATHYSEPRRIEAGFTYSF